MGAFEDFKKKYGIADRESPKEESTKEEKSSFAQFREKYGIKSREEMEQERQVQEVQGLIRTQQAVDNAQALSWMPGVGTSDPGKQRYSKALDWSVAAQKAEDAARADALDKGQQAKAQAEAMQTDIDAAKNALEDTKGKQSGETWWEVFVKAGEAAGNAMLGVPGQITPYSNSYRGQIDDQSQRVEELEGQQRDLTFQYYSSLFAADDFKANSAYRSTANGKAQQQMPIFDGFGNETGRYEYTETGYDDIIYDYINGDPGAVATLEADEMADASGLYGASKDYLKEMTEDEVALYNYIYRTQSPEAARAFIDLMKSDLYYKQNLKRVEAYGAFADQHPVLASVGSVAMAPMKVLGLPGMLADYADDGKMDTNAAYNQWSTGSAVIRDTVGQKIADASGPLGGLAEFGYQTVMSMGDFMMSTAVTGGNQALSLSLMGAGSTVDTVRQAKLMGYSDDQAFWLGAIAGGAEIAMEKIGMDALFDAAFRKNKGKLAYILKQALSEGGEEVGTELINTMADVIIAGDQSQMQRAIDAYMAGDPNMSESEAFGLWLRDKALEVGVSFAGGALSGGIMGGGMAAIDSAQISALASKIDKGSVYVDLGSVVAQGLALEQGTNGYTLAQQIEAQVEAGQDPSSKDVARLMLTIEAVQGDGQAAEEPAVDGEGNVAPAAPSPAPSGGTLPKGEGFVAPLVGEHERTSDARPYDGASLGDLITKTVEDYRTKGTVSNSQATQILDDSEAVAQLVELTGMELPETMAGRRNAVKQAVASLAQIEKVSLSDAAEDTSLSGSEAVQEAALSEANTSSLSRNVISEGASAASEAVRTSDARPYEGDGDTYIRETATAMGVKPAAVDVLVGAYHTGGDVDPMVYAQGIREAYEYGSVNMPFGELATRAPFASMLTEHQRKVAYELGQMFGGKKTAKEQATVRKDRKIDPDTSGGKVHFDGDRSSLSQIQRESLDAMEMMAKALGVQIHVFQSEDGNENGWYDPSDGSIHIDLNAGMDGKGTMLFTLAHELTHFIRQWSPAKFRVLVNFLMDRYGEKGVSVAELVKDQQDKAAHHGVELSYEEAYEEVIADSMEAMLTDGNVVRMMAELRQQDRTLWQKIRDWFKDLEKKIRSAIDAYKGVEPDSREGRMVAQMEDVLVTLESLYADALVDASENFAGAQKNTAGGGVKYSIKETTDGRYVAVVENDILKDIDTESWNKEKKRKAQAAASKALKQFSGGIVVDGITRQVNRTSRREYTRSKDTARLYKNNTELFADKMRAADVADDIVVAATNWNRDGGLTHPRADDFVDFDHGDTLIMSGQSKYSAEVVVGITSDGTAVFYDVVDMSPTDFELKNTEPHSTATANESLRDMIGGPAGSNVPQKGTEVKKKSSLRDTRGRELSVQQQEYFKDSMVRLDADGEYWYGEGSLAPVFHATDAEFTTFLKKHLGEVTAKNAADSFYEATAAVGFWFNTNDPVATGKMSGHSIEVYLDAKKLYDAGTLFGLASEIWDNAEAATSPKRAAKLFTDSLKTRGYDGIVIRDEEMGGVSFVVFESSQIKAVSNKTPTKKKDIRYSSRDTVAEQASKALREENAKLREDVSRLKELVKLQRTVTGGTQFSKSSVEAAARMLKKQAGAKGDTKELAGLLETFYGYIVKGEELSWEEVSQRAEPVAQWLKENQERKERRDDRASEILAQIRGSRVSLDDQQKQEAAYRYGSYNEFRKRALGTVLFTDKSGTTLDSFWGELAAQYPDIFDPGMNAADMPTAFMEAVTRLRSMTAADSYFEDSFDDQELIRQVYDSCWRASTVRTYADKVQKEISLLKAKHSRQMEALRTGRDDKIAQLKQQHRQSRERSVEGRKRTEMRHKIRGVVKELDQLLRRDDKKHHVPDKLKKAVAGALEMVDMEPVDLQARIRKYEALIDKTTDQDQIQAYQDAVTTLRDKAEAVGKRLEELRQGYEDILNSTDPDIASGYDPVIAGNLKELAETIGDTPLRDMTMAQLEDVYAMYKMVLTRVRDANKAFLAERSATISQIAGKVIREVETVGGKHSYLPGTGAARAFFWNNLKPIYAMEKIGSPALKDSFMGLIRGEGVYAQDVEQAKDLADHVRKKYGYGKWDMKKSYDFQSASGIDFQLTLGQILSLYAYSRRDQALEHLRLGGFVFDSSITTNEVVDEKGKKRKKLRKYKVNTASAHQLTPEILSEITDTLTQEQRQFVEEMQGYLSDTMGAKGNEVAMAMYGVKLFKEKNYFPLKSAKQYLFEQNEVAGEVRIKNSGFTQKTRAKANNPVILQDFMDVWAGHVHDMSMYHAFLLPLEDFNRIFNYNTPKSEGVDPKSVKGTVQNAYGEEAVKYVRQMITDLNGGARSDPREQPGKALMGKFKKAAVVASLSVAIQQPSALNRAKALVGDKYFLSLNPRLISMKRLWKELKTYAPVAAIKEMGRFDMDTSVSTVDYIKNEGGFMKKLDDATGWLPGKADEWTWVQIWAAVKKETAARRSDLDVGSRTFLQAAGERFTEVIVKTQVYDSTLSRSANMRSKNLFMSMATSFMAEPTTSINMIEDALRQFKRGYRRQAVKTVRAVLDSVVLNAVLVSLIYAMRDDDEDETFLEKYAASLTAEMIEGVNPLTYIPFVKDVWSLMRGYDVERSDMSLINDIVDALDRWGQLVGTDTSDMDEAALETHQQKLVGAAWTLVDGVASAFGIPLKNVRRDIDGAINTYKTATNGLDDNAVSFWNAVQDAVADAVPVVDWFYEETKADRLYQAIVTGDDAYRKRIEAQYSSEEALVSAVRKVFRERYLEGTVAEDMVVDALVSYGATEDEAKADVDYWRYSSDHPDEEVSAQWFDTYYDKVADSGIDVDTYVEYRQKAKGVTKKAEKMELIDDLPISRKQKDALYLAEGWAESKLGEAPWN